MTLLVIFDYFGTIAFAISGAITAVRHKMDIFGINMLAVTTATGGGMMRDIIMGNFPPQMFRNPIYVLTAAVTANILFFILRIRHAKVLPQNISHVYEATLFWFDTLGLAAFTVDGAMIGIRSDYGSNLFLITALSFLTGVGGGLLRDILAGETPAIFRKHIYALASIAGGLFIGILSLAGIPGNISMACGFLAVLLIRYCARRFLWNLPKIPRN